MPDERRNDKDNEKKTGADNQWKKNFSHKKGIKLGETEQMLNKRTILRKLKWMK